MNRFDHMPILKAQLDSLTEDELLVVLKAVVKTFDSEGEEGGDN